MRISIISHAAVIATNQEKLVALSKYPDLRLQLITPAYWRALHMDHGYHAFTGNAGLFETCPVKTTPDVRSVSYLYYPGLYAALRRFRPDIVQFEVEPYSLTAFQGMMMARAVRAKLVIVAWQNLPLRLPWPFSAVEHAVLERASGVLAGNHDALAVVRAKGYLGPASVIGQGHDPAIAPLPAQQREALRQRLGLSRFTIGFAGRLTDQKGVHLLLQASARIKEPHQVLIVGEGPARKQLTRLAVDLGIAGKVIFTGALAEHRMVPAYMGSMDLFVLPSITMPKLKEQFGLVLVEAMVCGVPVIGSSSGEIPNIVGDAGLIVPENDAVALSAAIGRVMGDAALRRSMIHTGQARARRHFSWSAVAEKSYDLYQQLVSQ